MIKLLLKIFLLITLTSLVLFGFVDSGYKHIDKTGFSNTIEDFNKTVEDTNIDIIFYGSSHSFWSYNPQIINDQCKVISHNLGSGAQKLITTKYLISETIEKANPQLVVLDVFRGTLNHPVNEKEISFQYQVCDNLSSYFSKSIYAFKNFGFDNGIKVLSPTIRNHSKWFDFNVSKNYERFYYSRFPQKEFNSGFTTYHIDLNEKDKKTYSKLFNDRKGKEREFKSSLEKYKKRDIIEVINTLKDKSPNVLIVTTPYLSYLKENIGYYKVVEAICDSLEVDFLNMNNHSTIKSMNLTLNDFKDRGHLNYNGSVKVSQFLSSFINENYKLIKKKDSQIWNDEMSKTIKFQIENNLDKSDWVKDVDFPLNDKITINKISCFKEAKEQYVFLYKLDDNFDEKELMKIKPQFKIIPFEEDEYFFNEKTATKNLRNFSFKPILKKNQYGSFLFNRVQIPIKKIKEIQLYTIKDKSNKLIIKDIEL